jgi:hypothetical protein
MNKDMKLANLFAKAGEKKLASHERREAMGKEKDTPAIAKEEMGALKKAKAPASLMKYEKDEHSEMGMKRGGKIKKYAKGGGIESKGKTKVKRFDEGGDIDTEGYGTKLEGKSKPQNFKEAFASARKDGGKTFTWNGKNYTTELASSKPKATANDLSDVNVTAKRIESDEPNELGRNRTYDKFVHAMAPGTRTAPSGREPEMRGGTRKRTPITAQPTKEGGYSSAEKTLYNGDEPEYLKKGGPVKKYARGGGIESKGKTRGRFI